MLIRFLWSWLAAALAFLVAAHLLKGFDVKGFGAALAAAAVLGIANAVVRPVLFWMTLPITILTLGLFTLALNGLMLWGVTLVVPGVRIANPLVAIFAAVVISLTTTVLGWLPV